VAKIEGAMLAARALSTSTFVVRRSVPVWLIAVAAAAAAPICVRWYASWLEKHSRRRTERALGASGGHDERFDTGSREDRKRVDG
jgi:hypothetical protein